MEVMTPKIRKEKLPRNYPKQKSTSHITFVAASSLVNPVLL